jgi:hypothetical protein
LWKSRTGPPPTEPTSRSGAPSRSKSAAITERESESMSAREAYEASRKSRPSRLTYSLLRSYELRLNPLPGISNGFSTQNSPDLRSIGPISGSLALRSRGCVTTARQ